jgi:hypothetical protein
MYLLFVSLQVNSRAIQSIVAAGILFIVISSYIILSIKKKIKKASTQAFLSYFKNMSILKLIQILSRCFFPPFPHKNINKVV